MYTNDFNGSRLSALGLGCMRLPVVDGNDANVDKKAVVEMVEYAMAHGINYYDTAWGYHAEHSEEAIGAALANYPRESFYLADKFPGYDLANISKVEEIFPEQLRRCGVENFDFYLFHNVCEMNIDAYLDPQYRIFEYLSEQKKAGRIKHLGFSAHGSLEVMECFLKAYGESMEFCQIQLNYLDYKLQKAEDKIKLLSRYGIPVWVMEPVRGGRLVNLEPEYREKLASVNKDMTTAEWAFRFLQGLPEVKMILSGMSNMQQLRENIETFSEKRPLEGAEIQALDGVVGDMLGKKTLPCTACHYCTPHCPQGLNIPELIALYNQKKFTGDDFIAPMALSRMAEDKKPSACIGCRSCEAVCPQGIKISEAMADFVQIMKG